MSREARWFQPKVCEACGRSFLAARSDARSCGATCKKRLQRIAKRQAVPSIAAVAVEGIYAGWPHGAYCTCSIGGEKKPGRIDWNYPRKPATSGDEVPVNLGFEWRWLNRWHVDIVACAGAPGLSPLSATEGI